MFDNEEKLPDLAVQALDAAHNRRSANADFIYGQTRERSPHPRLPGGGCRPASCRAGCWALCSFRDNSRGAHPVPRRGM